ncbi:hypothetical protein E4Q08_02700 [Candidatus Accumulibacter phosphatis]|uniref:Uncharacterized protein n=1 Tax=Candidatus Accumulibacter contiguus TaxID=2954381 RepID=A0ABX1T562_9PROT|nr:hypothetical protein [Candidatus Accumulibacter contiguus]NMQ04243.1 hypothetical protein [Candidatus Accumulibacter contiguus]
MKEQDDEYAGFWVRTIAAISDRTQILTALITYPLLISMANKVLAKTAARAAEARSSNLGHDNLTEILAKSEVLVGKLLKFTTPSARSMTLEEVERWFQGKMAELGTMLDAKLSLKLQVEEAYMLKEHLLEGAKVALKHEKDIALFASWHPTTPLERLRSELSEQFSGKKTQPGNAKEDHSPGRC